MSRTLRALTALRVWAAVLALVIATVAGAVTVFRAEALPPVIDVDSTPTDLTLYGDDVTDSGGRAAPLPTAARA